MKRSWWLSSELCTIRVETDERNIITWAAPIVRKFIGQPLANLERWQRAKAVLLSEDDGHGK